MSIVTGTAQNAQDNDPGRLPNSVVDQSLQNMLVKAAARHIMTGLGGSLVTLGMVAPDDENKFVNIGAGIIVWLAGYAWSWWNKTGHALVLARIRSLRGGK